MASSTFKAGDHVRWVDNTGMQGYYIGDEAVVLRVDSYSNFVTVRWLRPNGLSEGGWALWRFRKVNRGLLDV